ncbi:unnamed protein product [Rotaria sp. Silwood1]|nr:unnamed protein product [Rotaria sp. Silwood1]CAF1611215.1 unnamed protein product [Rotaria sp. Silwood1]CAF4662882.1 unnamed protein product [Rotaria sp. Silwood1]CAF4664999.1 unnamed protein product [Rotaria sp. Silwood1]
MQYKNILIVLSIYLTLALNSAECEHGYSIANRIQINGRSRLMIETLDALMNVRMLLFPDDVRRTLRKQLNSYVMYLLAASITNWVLINTSLISSLYDVDHIDPQNTSLIVCKLRIISPGSDYTQYRLRKSDRDLMKMVAGEVFVYLVSTILYAVNTLYGFITGPIAQQKSGMRLAIEALAGFIVSPLLSFLYCVTPFYGRVRLSILY